MTMRGGLLLWCFARYTKGIENKVAPPAHYKLGAKETRYQPSPGRPQRGKRKRQWR